MREQLAILGRDIHYAFRMMRRTPGFTILAVVMLALGTGANVAVFTVIDAVMLRSPFVDPDRIAMVRVADRNGRFTLNVPAERHEALAAAPRTLAAVAAYGNGSHILTGSGDPRRLNDLECVSASMFNVLGTQPFLGRVFTAEEDRPGAAPTIVLSYEFWQELGKPSDIPGRTLTLNRTSVTALGVMPRGFSGPRSRNGTSGWVPLGVTLNGGGLTGCSASGGVNVFARLQDGVSRRDAEAALPGIQLMPLDDVTFDDLRTPFLVLAAAVGCVLLIACLNVGGLQLERAVARRREIALHVALGASRARVIRQTLTENLMLALAGAAAGVAATFVTLRGLISLLPANMPRIDEIAVNGRVLLAATIAAGAAGLVAGLVPVLQMRQFTPARDLVEGARSSTSRSAWTRRGFVVAEIALSLVVLIGAGLMMQTFRTLRFNDPGFDPRGKLTTLVRLPGVAPNASGPVFDRLFDRVRAIPGVRAVAGSSYLPVASSVAVTTATLDGASATAYGAVVTPDYLDIMKIPVIAGRGFTAEDTPGSSRVALVNEAFARKLRADGAVLGQRVRAIGPRRPRGEAAVDWQIVGIVGNTRSSGAHTRPSAEFYVPLAQNPVPTLYLLAQADAPQHALVSAEIRRAMRDVHPELAVESIDPLANLLNRRVGTPRLGAWLLGIFAVMAVALAGVGLMTTIGWWVSQRTRELGVRMALGASHGQLVRLVFRQGFALGVSGVAVGCLLAIAVTRYLEGWIYGITPLDALTFAGAASLMFAVIGVAISVPMRRALHVDPVVALRAE